MIARSARSCDDCRVNYLAHGWHATLAGDPWELAGTALPDWLRVVDRRMRAVRDRAAACAAASDPRLASLAHGVLRHFDDDARFHTSAEFAAASAEVVGLLRPAREQAPGLRLSFVAHVLVEMLLDAELMRRDPARLGTYYDLLSGLDADEVERLATPLATKPAAGLAPLVREFVSSRFLEGYADDAALVRRLARVLRRARQPDAAAAILPALPAARAAVAARTPALFG